MVEQMRTNVLKREEKGFGPISFPRLLLSGLTGAFVMLTFSQLIGFFVAIVVGIILGGLMLVFTQPISGEVFARFMVKSIKGALMVAAVKADMGEAEPSLPARILISMLSIEPDAAVLHCDEVFNVNEEDYQEEDSAGGLVFFSDITDLDTKGFQVVDNPFGASSD